VIRLERLKIEKYRRIAPNTELHFSPRHNVLLGKNATGKSTLLELIARVVSWDFSGLRGEPFALEYEIRAGDVGQESGDIVHVQIRHEPGEDEGPPGEHVQRGRHGRTEATIRLPSGATLRVEPRSSTLAWRDGEPRAIEPISLLRPQFILGLYDGASPIEVPGSLYCDVVERFEEGLETYRRMEQTVQVYRPSPEGLRLDGWPSLPFFQWEDAERVMGGEEPDKISLSHDDYPVLRELAKVMDLEALTLRLFRGAESPKKVTYQSLTFYCRRRDGTVDTNSELSYGERRLIALWWYLAANPDIAVVDEMVNGLHHSWIDAVMSKISDRQSFLTSQNPLLMDYVGFDSVDDVQRTFLVCPGPSSTGLVARNLTKPEAENFFAAHRIGIQHVSEILRDLGLW
jgi:energy-coupling factor transporter ATP-binding protein EcfA2